MFVEFLNCSNRLKQMTVFVMLFIVMPAFAQSTDDADKPKTQIQYTVEDDFVIFGDYLFSQHGGVILLHGCQSDRSDLIAIARVLARQGHHALTIHFRGYGESTSELYSEQNIKRITKDLVAYQNELARYMSYWETDVLAGYHYLRAKVARDQPIAVVAIGCAASQAVALAEKVYVDQFVFVSPKMGFAEKERYKNLLDKPTYFISSAHDVENYLTATELFEWNGDKNSKFQIFKGSRSANSLLRHDEFLAKDIALWLMKNNRTIE